MEVIKNRVFAVIFITLVSVAAYANSFHAAFQFDDYHQIVDNQHIRSLSNVPAIFTDPSAVTYIVGSRAYRPVTIASFAIDYALWGYDVRGWHAVNIALHICNALLVYFILLKILKANAEGNRAGPMAALFTAAVFAVHPLQTAAVTYISGRAVLLATLFGLLSFHALLCFRERGGALRAAAVAVFLAVGLLSKEVAVCFIGLMVVYDLIMDRPPRGRRAAVFIPTTAVLAVYVWIKILTQGELGDGSSAYTRGVYYLSEAKAFLLYLRLAVLPVNQNADYNLAPALDTDGWVALSLLILTVIVAAAVYLRKKDPVVSFFLIWPLACLAPEATIVVIPDIAVEYRMYTALAGLAALAAVMLSRLTETRRPAVAVSAVFILFCILTPARNRVWATEYTFWSDVAVKSPWSAHPHVALGKVLFNEKDYVKGMAELRRALNLAPEGYTVCNDVGLMSLEAGDVKGAIEALRKAVDIRPDRVEAYNNLGLAYRQSGRLDEAAAAFRRAVDIDPGYHRGHFNLGIVYDQQGKDPEALAEMAEAVKLSPRDYDSRCAYATLLLVAGRNADAAAQAAEGVAVSSNGDERRVASELREKASKKAGLP